MLGLVPLLLAAPALFSSASAAPFTKRDKPKLVFAHVVVGLLNTFDESDWANDIALAQQTGIDGFALNIGTDSFTDTQLGFAYSAAAQVGFKCFISFDFGASPGFSDFNTNIVPRLQRFATDPAAVIVDGKSLVSTFIGDGFAWDAVKAAVSAPLLVLPFYAPQNVNTPGIDGLFNFNSWPNNANVPINATIDLSVDNFFLQQLGGRPYMMAASPWFFTHFPANTFNKNFLFLSDTLVVDRLNEVLTVQPDFLEIITWNDYGESHYIGPLHEEKPDTFPGGDSGAIRWAKGFPHDGWREIYKAYIAAYKTGATSPIITDETVVYWYRPHPKATQCADPFVGPPTGSDFPGDAIFAATLLNTPATLVINGQSFDAPAGVNYFAAGLANGQPTFALQRGGQTIKSGTGELAISDGNCDTFNFNAFVGTL